MPAVSRSESKDWLGLNQDNVSEWSDMSTHGAVSSTMKILLIVLFQCKVNINIECNCSCHDKAEKCSFGIQK